MKIITTRVGRATNGPSRTTVAQVSNSEELVALRVVVEADSYEPQCRVHVSALNTVTNEWGSPLIWRTAYRTHASYDHKSSSRADLRASLMELDEQEALRDALAILNAGRKENLE